MNPGLEHFRDQVKKLGYQQPVDAALVPDLRREAEMRERYMAAVAVGYEQAVRNAETASWYRTHTQQAQ